MKTFFDLLSEFHQSKFSFVNLDFICFLNKDLKNIPMCLYHFDTVYLLIYTVYSCTVALSVHKIA